MSTNATVLRVFGRMILLARSKLGITQADLAEAVGVTHTTIINIEKGRHSANGLLTFKMIKFLDLDVGPALAQIEINSPSHVRARRLKRQIAALEDQLKKEMT